MAAARGGLGCGGAGCQQLAGCLAATRAAAPAPAACQRQCAHHPSPAPAPWLTVPTCAHPVPRRRYARALELLLTALTAPTLVLNAITVACLKKYLVLSLVHAGAVAPLPKHTAPLIS